MLIPTRSFGDFLLKSEHEKPPWKQVISAVPQIQISHLDSQWEFVIVASDGIWDAMSNQDMITFVRQRLQTHSHQRQGFLNTLYKKFKKIHAKFSKKTYLVNNFFWYAKRHLLFRKKNIR